MAEGWAHALKADLIKACGINPNAVRVMAEAGVDINDK
jgi:hypothetical protein